MIFLSIDYDEPDQDSYRGCYAKMDGSIIARFATNNPVLDWQSLVDYLVENNLANHCGVLSSCDHFVMDGDKWSWNEDGMLVHWLP